MIMLSQLRVLLHVCHAVVGDTTSNCHDIIILD